MERLDSHRVQNALGYCFVIFFSFALTDLARLTLLSIFALLLCSFVIQPVCQDMAVYDDIGMVGFELWTVNNGTIFDNILITDDVEYAKKMAEEVWKPTSEGEKKAKETWERARQAEREAAESKEKEAKETMTTAEAKLKTATLAEEVRWIVNREWKYRHSY